MQEIEFYFGTGKKWLFDLIEAIQEKIGSKLVVTSNNNIITWSTKYREGKAEFIELEEGLGLVRADYMLNETLTFKHIPSKSNDYFLFILASVFISRIFTLRAKSLKWAIILPMQLSICHRQYRLILFFLKAKK